MAAGLVDRRLDAGPMSSSWSQAFKAESEANLMIERHHFRPRQSACVPGKPTSLRSFVKQCSIISILGCLGQQPASSSGTFSHCSGGALVACGRRFIMASNSVCPVADSFGRCLGGCSCSCSSTGLVLSSVWGKAANEHKELVITLLVLAFRSLKATGRSTVTSLKRLKSSMPLLVRTLPLI